jgi:two-component sensor histidine kinase
MPDLPAQTPSDHGPLSERGFWMVFSAAWLAYSGLFLSVAVFTEGTSFAWGLMLALTNAAPPALVAIPIAARRRDLLRPEWSFGRTLLVHVVVGFAYAAVTAVLVTLFAAWMGYEEPGLEGAGKLAVVASRTVLSGFLYVALAGYIMWAESIRRVHESRTLAAREAVLRAQAEAKALRAQFNPHFVFNTLHSLMLLVRADPAAAEQAIEDVATLIRYASILQRNDIDVVPLTKELEVARRYLALEQLRLEERLRVGWVVDVDATAVAIPSFSLQTLIENAIKHGIEPRPEGGVIEIAIRLRGEALEVVVADDGAGADAATVRTAEGRGLQLLQQRLETLYGDGASVRWESEPGRGFRATLRFPAGSVGTVPQLDVIHTTEAAR